MSSTDRPTPCWDEEWANLSPATRLPREGSKAKKLFNILDATPTVYRELWESRANFPKDPFLRTALRRWAKAGWVHREVREGETEYWSRPVTTQGA